MLELTIWIIPNNDYESALKRVSQTLMCLNIS